MIAKGRVLLPQMRIGALPLRKSVRPAGLMEKKKQQERRSWRKRRTEKMHTGIALQERCTEKEEISWLESSSNLRDILQSWRRQGARNRVSVHLTCAVWLTRFSPRIIIDSNRQRLFLGFKFVFGGQYGMLVALPLW